MKNDIDFMRRAIHLAELGLYTTSPNPRVGCVIVNNKQIISEGWHEKAGQQHAEIMALDNALQSVVGATCYVTLEPCCMCAGAIIHARLDRIVFAASDARTGAAGGCFSLLQHPSHNHKLTVEGGCLSEASSQMLKSFFRKKRVKGT